jgi:hypothetical protein
VRSPAAERFTQQAPQRLHAARRPLREVLESRLGEPQHVEGRLAFRAPRVVDAVAELVADAGVEQ